MQQEILSPRSAIHRPVVANPPLHTLPALKAAIFIGLGISLGFWLSLPVMTLLIIAVGFLLFSLAFYKTRYSNPLLIASLIVATAASLPASLLPNQIPTTLLTIQGRVSEPPRHFEDRLSFPVQLEYFSKDDQRLLTSGRVWVRMSGNLPGLKPGLKVKLTGWLVPNPSPRNPGDYDLNAWRLRNEYIGELLVTDASRVSIIGTRLPIIYRVQNGIAAACERYGGEYAALWQALLLGIRRDLDPTLIEELKETGLSHLLALSGLHVGFLIVMVVTLGALLRLPISMRAVLAIAVILVFAVIVPARGSTLRAVIMSAALFSGVMLKRWTTMLNCLALAALVILVYRPGELYDAGFQLSFAATGGIVLYHKQLESFSHRWLAVYGPWGRRLTHYVLVPFLISCAATLMVMPLTSYHFGLMALGAPIFNLVAIPLLGLIFAGGWVVALLSLVSHSLAGLTADGVNLLALLWHQIVHWFAVAAPTTDWRFAPISIALLLAIIIWAARSSRSTRFRFLAAAAVIVAVLVADGVIPRISNLQIWFLDVGHGDAALWLFPDGRTAVVDDGPVMADDRPNPVEQTLARFNRRRIDLLVASHPESDHIGGLVSLVEKYPIGIAITSPVSANTDLWRQLMDASERKGVEWQRLTGGAQIQGLSQDYRLSVLNPPPGVTGWSTNNSSLGLLLEAPVGKDGKLRLLTAGDAELEAEAAMMGQEGIEAELLKVSHHGSSTSSSVAFLEMVSPKIAVISRAGWNEVSRYRSPTEVLDRLRRRGVIICQTNLSGAVLLEPYKNTHAPVWRLVDWRHPAFVNWLLGRV